MKRKLYFPFGWTESRPNAFAQLKSTNNRTVEHMKNRIRPSFCRCASSSFWSAVPMNFSYVSLIFCCCCNRSHNSHLNRLKHDNWVEYITFAVPTLCIFAQFVNHTTDKSRALNNENPWRSSTAKVQHPFFPLLNVSGKNKEDLPQPPVNSNMHNFMCLFLLFTEIYIQFMQILLFNCTLAIHFFLSLFWCYLFCFEEF